MAGILEPIALCFAPILLGLGILLFNRAGEFNQRRQKLGLAPLDLVARRAAFTMLPVVLMTIALLRPYAGSTEIELPAPTHDYMFVVDVSRSMFAKDVPPSRIELAKRKLRDLIDAFAKQGSPHRYGITLFAGYSYLLCPITDDISVLKQFISEISPEMVTSMGSDLEAGMKTALARFTQGERADARILLISDGEDDALSVSRVEELIRTSGVRVDVLGVGTRIGTPIELPDGKFVRNSKGDIVHSKLAEEALKDLAAAGGGMYVEAGIDDRDISQLTRRAVKIDSGARGALRRIITHQEFGSWLALAALVVIISYAGIPKISTWIGIFLLSLVWVNTAIASPLTSPKARQAYELYNTGDYSGAAQAFKEALDSAPNDRALLQGYASALFKLERFSEAEKIFEKLTTQTDIGREYFENAYNHGNALLAQKRYQDAIDAYTRALDVKPDDARAAHNRAIARTLLEEAKNKPTPTPSPTSNPKQSPQPSPSPEGSPNQEQKQDQGQDESQTQNKDQRDKAEEQREPEQESKEQEQKENNSSDQTANKEAPQAKTEPDQPIDQKQDPAPRPTAPSPTASNSAAPQALDTRSPTQREAQAWLESLPESPLLIRRERDQGKSTGQNW